MMLIVGNELAALEILSSLVEMFFDAIDHQACAATFLFSVDLNGETGIEMTKANPLLL